MFFSALVLSWWMTFCLPFDLFWKHFSKNPVFMFVISIGTSISSGHAVTSWGVDKALFNAAHVNAKRISDSIFTCIFCGTLSACGGGLLNDWLSISRNPSFQSKTSPAIFQVGNYAASATMTRAFICAVIYYIALNPSSYISLSYAPLTREQGHLLIAILQLGHSLAKLIADFDMFQLVADIGLSMALIDPVFYFHQESNGLKKGKSE